MQLIELSSKKAIEGIEKTKGNLDSQILKLESNLSSLSKDLKVLQTRKLCYYLEARINGDSCSSNGGWTTYKGDGKTPDKIRVYYCD
ncbi:hypothetical protein [Shewanella salipaludis]|uniref:Uncharacterized protein n=1 Tax=Shewanella salipaludis TaxID=2723052 RepID=A0A972FPK5_9GAMM|nr:hypothetical protein [Shewanella salipaludis]NMH63768.1 hypothetical protein [Shewanella salipaludis]